jgi:hypothetical protein
MIRGSVGAGSASADRLESFRDCRNRSTKIYRRVFFVLAGPSPPPPPLFIFVLFLVGLFAHTLFRIRTPYFNGQAAAVATNYVLIETIQLDNDVEMQTGERWRRVFRPFHRSRPRLAFVSHGRYPELL